MSSNRKRARFPSAILAAAFCLAASGSRLTAAEFIVTSTANAGAGTLRQAILNANAAGGADTIRFNLPAPHAPVRTLNISSPLPNITGTVTMDGATQPGSNAIQLFYSGPDLGPPMIVLGAPECLLKNLIIVSSAQLPSGITLLGEGLLGKGRCTLESIQVGIAADNSVMRSFSSGIDVLSTSNSIQGCRVGGAQQTGIYLLANDNVVKGCRIGSKEGPNQDAGNHIGISLGDSTGNRIGSETGESDANVIAHNGFCGIAVSGGGGHRILKNRFGLPGDLQSGNGAGIRGYGIVLSYSEDVLIKGNIFEATNGSHVGINEGSRKVTVAECVMSSATSAGIEVGINVLDTLIEDNVIRKNTPTGILVSDSQVGDEVIIRHNSISEVGTGIHVKTGRGQVTIGTRRDLMLPASNRIFACASGAVVVSDPEAAVKISENAIMPVQSVQGPGYGYRLPVDLVKPGGEVLPETPNDPLDADEGPNGLQNKPVISSVTDLGGGRVGIIGTLHSTPSEAFTVEACQYRVPGSGETWLLTGAEAGWLGSAPVSTDAGGNASFEMTVSNWMGLGTWEIALTATSSTGATSEYSAGMPLVVTVPPAPPLAGQGSLTLPESHAAAGQSFTIDRPAGAGGDLVVTLQLEAQFPRDAANLTPRQALKYRLAENAPWALLDWSTPAAITLPAGLNSLILSLAAQDDSSWDPEAKPSVLRYSVPGQPVTLIPVTFPDNDSPPFFTVRNVQSGLASLAESAVPGDRTFVLRADRPSTAAYQLDVQFSPAGSTAAPGTDFTLSPQNIRLLFTEGGLSSSAWTVNPITDGLVEGDEQVNFSYAGTGSAAGLTGDFGIVVKDSDFHRLALTPATWSQAEGSSGSATSFAFTVTCNPPPPSGASVAWSVAHFTTAANDFAGATGGTANLAPGQGSAMLEVPVMGDTLPEGDEQFRVNITLAGLPSTFVLDSAHSSMVTIVNDDFPSVVLADLEVEEISRSVFLPVTLSHPAPFACFVSYRFVPGTATGGSDFSGMAGTLNFPAGATSRNIPFSIMGDSIPEADETFAIELHSPAQVMLPTPPQVTVTIRDNDVPSAVFPVLTEITEGDEGAQQVSLTVALAVPAARAASVDWQMGPATPGVAGTAGTLHFAPGSQSATISVTVAGNRVPEVDRSLSLTFSNPCV